MKVNLKDYIEKIRTHLDLDVIPFSIFIDATKISRGIYLSSANNWIVGYASPNNEILIENKSIEQVLFMLKVKEVNMVHEEEAKVAVVTFQQVSNVICP